jgi:hypothetical protein
MRFTKFVSRTLACLALGPAVARAEISAELLDLAGRVQYGYYQADERAIEAALTGPKWSITETSPRCALRRSGAATTTSV